ncbi:MAG: dihydroneopterin aldolase [Bacteroidota bacterium]|nr:dihydroneopterin aldolase [Bacteroidota bacterium]MDE2957005.1 dihydroneopterin aldolase [Bacteroidota bacterium]
MHSVRLNRAVFTAHHGVKSAEQQAGGSYEVDVSMDVDFEEAARTDDLHKTVDYACVYGLVEGLITTNRFKLLERIAWKIAHRILEEFPEVVYVEVAVRKMNPPLGGSCASSEVIYRAPRWPTA